MIPPKQRAVAIRLFKRSSKTKQRKSAMLDAINAMRGLGFDVHQATIYRWISSSK